MSIFKDTFRNYVRDQLAIREELIDLGNTNDQGIRSIRRNPSPRITLPSGNNITFAPDTFYSYALSKQCVIRMTSLVDYVEDVNLEVGGYGKPGDAGFERLKGATLSQNFILEGGVLSDFARNINGEKIVKRVKTPRESFPTPGLKTNLSYGDLAVAGDATSDGYGIVPMPGITDATIRTKSAYGSLREAKINFECHNRRQLEILEMLYMRPGYMAVVEWGWAPYITNTGKLETNLRLIEDKLKIEGVNESLIYTNDITQQMVYNAINSLKEEASGNYDAFLGIVKNFGFQAREDGGFTCYTEMTSMNEVIESIKTPNVSIFNPIIGENPTNDTVNAQQSKIVVQSQENYNIYGYKTGDSRGGDRSQTFEINQEGFNKALSKGIFPKYSGLEGLTKNLKIFSTFNSFTLSSIFQAETLEDGGGNPLGDNIYKDDIDDIFGETDVSSLQQELGYKASNLRNRSGTQVEGNLVNRNIFLRDLLRYQGESIQEILLKKLNLNDFKSSREAGAKINLEDLKNYIIPKGGFLTDFITGELETAQKSGEYASGGGTDLGDVQFGGDSYQYESKGIDFEGYDEAFIRANDESYIRWDALVVLLNESLMTTNEKGEKPVYIVCDKIVDLDNKKSRYDVLKYVPVSGYEEKDGKRYVYDFSCDPNICILPNQLNEAGYRPLVETIGYKPNLNIFTKDYHLSIFNKDINQSIEYNNSPLLNDTLLSKTDENRRIGNIFLNIEMLDEIASKNANKDDYTLGNFINDIWDKVNSVCPNHNFVLTDDKESNAVYIIDLPVSQEETPLDLHTFIPFSNKNILRQFSYTSNVPSALSATIAIQAQDPRSIQDIDGVTFAAFNRSIKNRIQSDDITSNFSKTQKTISEQREEVIFKQKALRSELKKFRDTYFKRISLQANEKELPPNNIKGVLKEFQKNKAYIDVAKNATTGGASFNSVIPLEFNAELDGISGIVIGNMFKIRKDRLPKAYEKANIGFIVFNEEQSITAGGDWTTKIGGKMTILPSAEVKRRGTFFEEPPEDPPNNPEVKVDAKEAELASIGELASIEIIPTSNFGTAGEEFFTIRIQNFAVPGNDALIRAFIDNIDSPIRPNDSRLPTGPSQSVSGGFLGSDLYEFTVSGATFANRFDAGVAVRQQIISLPRVTNMKFEGFQSDILPSKIIIETSDVNPTVTATPPGSPPPPPPPPPKPGPTITIELTNEFTRIVNSGDNSFSSLFPNA
jgi:hypothetical protein